MRFVLVFVLGAIVGAEMEEVWEAKCREVEAAEAWTSVVEAEAEMWIEKAGGAR